MGAVGPGLGIVPAQRQLSQICRLEELEISKSFLALKGGLRVDVRRIPTFVSTASALNLSTQETEAASGALARAREKIGAGYDFLGVVGIPSKKRFYCSELAVWAWGIAVDRLGPHRVVHPKNLHKLGTVLFDTGSRDGEPD